MSSWFDSVVNKIVIDRLTQTINSSKVQRTRSYATYCIISLFLYTQNCVVCVVKIEFNHVIDLDIYFIDLRFLFTYIRANVLIVAV